MPVSLDLAMLVKWLGPEGASAGLRESRLSVKDLIELARARGLPLSPKPTREELANEIAFAGIRKIDKSLDDLMVMNQSDLFEYLKRKKPTVGELLQLLADLGVKPGSEDRKHLLRFAAREISDTGMYERVARGGQRETSNKT